MTDQAQPTVTENADALRGRLRTFILPDGFKDFLVERTEKITDSLSLTFRLPSSLDTEWALNQASRASTTASGFTISYIGRIMAACCTQVNGVKLHDLVNEETFPHMMVALYPEARNALDLPQYIQTLEWVYVNVVGKIPNELLNEVWKTNGLGQWVNTVNGMLTPATNDALEKEAIGDLSVVLSAPSAQAGNPNPE